MAISLSDGIPRIVATDAAAALRGLGLVGVERMTMKRTESMPEGARQSWFLTEPVVGIRIPATHFDYQLEERDPVVEVGSAPPSAPQDGTPPPKRFVVRSPHVSKLHCTIELRNGRWIVVAQPSGKNGIYLGEVKHNEGRRTFIELVPGLRFLIGSVPFVAYSAAEERARVVMQRYFGLGEPYAPAVDGVLALANETKHVILQQPTGGGGVAIARAIHDASPRVSWPFVAPLKIGETRRDWYELLNAAAYGTLALRSDQLPVHRDELLNLLASWEYPVRLVLVMPRGERAGNVVGDRMLTASAIVPVPSIEDRRNERVGLVSLFCQEAVLRLGAPNVKLPPKVWVYVERHTWPENIEELERFVERVLALQLYKHNGSKAAKALGIAVSTMNDWAKSHNIKALLA